MLSDDRSPTPVVVNEQQNKDASAALVALLDATVDAVVIINHQGSIELFNQAAEALFGYASAEVIGQNVNLLMPDPYKSAHDQYLANYMRTKQPRIIGTGREVKARKSNGEIFPIELSVGEVKQSSHPQFVGIIRDISERVQAQADLFETRERLSQVSRLSTMGEMTAGIAHEINQPLSAVASYAQAGVNLINNAKRQQVELPEQKISAILDKINAQALRAGQVISRLRGFVKQRKAQHSTINLNKLIDETINLAKVDTRLLAHGIHLHLTVDPVPLITVDAIQIQQVLFNLIRNAIDAMETQQNEPVLIRSRWLNDKSIEVSVSDSGIGVSKENENMLFNPFFTTKESGMGIGLSISQTIIQSHGGTLEHCQGVPRGSVFAFTLPASGLLLSTDTPEKVPHER